MRCLARTIPAALGLAFIAPTIVLAGMPITPPKPKAKEEPHIHRAGLFGKRHLCPDCQRKELRAKGIEVPPPPDVATAIAMQEAGQCEACQVATTGPITPVAPGRAVVNDGAPGRAVVGGEMLMAEPSPVGTVAPRLNAFTGRMAPTDNAVRPTSIAPPQPILNPSPDRTHVLGPAVRTLSRVAGLRAIGHDRREERARRKGQEHASIAYGPESFQNVTELDSSVVFSRRMMRQAPIAPPAEANANAKANSKEKRNAKRGPNASQQALRLKGQ